jgi:hypothetical protein
MSRLRGGIKIKQSYQPLFMHLLASYCSSKAKKKRNKRGENCAAWGMHGKGGVASRSRSAINVLTENWSDAMSPACMRGRSRRARELRVDVATGQQKKPITWKNGCCRGSGMIPSRSHDQTVEVALMNGVRYKQSFPRIGLRFPSRRLDRMDNAAR